MATMTNSQRIKELRNKRKEEEQKKSSSSTPKAENLGKQIRESKADFFKTNSAEQLKENKNTSFETTTANKNSDKIKTKRLQNTIDFDTFQSDLSSMGTTISNIYKGWQSPETMKNTRESIASMQKRLNAYQEYQKIYGGADLSDIASGYNDLLTDWDDRTKTYGKYKSADEYDNAMKLAKAEIERRASMPSANLDEIQAEIDRLKGIEEQAKPYADAADKAIHTRNTSAESLENIRTSREKLEKFYQDNGFANADELAKAISEKSQYKNQAKLVQDSIKLSKDIRKDADYEKYASAGEALGNEKADGWFVPDNQRKNPVAYLRNNPDAMKAYEEASKSANGFSFGTVERQLTEGNLEYKLAKYGTDEQLKDYYAYLGKGDEENAQKYLQSIEQSLNEAMSVEIADDKDNTWKQISFSGAVGLDQFEQGTKNLLNTSDDYIPPSPTQLASGQVREKLDEVGFDNVLGLGSSLGQMAYDLGTTTFNMAPSILASSVSNMILPGSGAIVGGATMGASAAGNAYQEKINQGWDKDQARVYSTAIGISEGALQYALGGISSMGGKLSGESIKAMATGIDNALVRYIATMGIKGMSEGIEESLQEIIAPFIENLALGYAKNDWSDVELAEVAYSGLLGALSAGLLEGGGTAVEVFGENHKAKGIGATVRNAERMSDAFDIASLTPQESDAYNLYTAYAKKGVNAESASDLQLGRLVFNSENASRDVLQSRKASPEQRVNAWSNLEKIENIKNDADIKNRAKELSAETKGKNPLEEGTTIQGIKVGEDTKIVTDKGEMSLEEVALPEKQAEVIARAERMPEALANLFVTQYNGVTDVNQYANDFNLAVAYSENAFPQDTILKNKGSLSEGQVAEIYKATRSAIVKANQEAINNITQKHSKGTFLKGNFDDSIVDYNNSTTDGSKVNWKDLTIRQRDAIKFAKMFSKATGANVRFIQSAVKNGKRVGKNGSYDPDTNTIEIDIYAGIDGQYVSDAIIPTLSHEITHWMKAKSPAIYEAISEEIKKTLAKDGKLTWNDRIAKEKRRIEKKHGKEVSDDYAMDELVARACEDMLSNSNQARKLLAKMTVKEQQSFIQKVKETLDNLIEWANELLAQYKSESEEAKLLRQYRTELKKISKMWDEMLVSAIESNQALQKEGKTGEQLAREVSNVETKADVQYDIREEYAHEVDAWEKDGKPDGESFILGTTGDVLQGLGAIESDIYMLGDKIKEILNDHPEMTIDEIKKIPQILENPILILKSRNVGREDADNRRLVIFGNVKAKDGRPILSVLDLRPVEKNLVVADMQKVSSAYTKDVEPEAFVRRSLVVYADKKRTTKLLRSIGFKIPIELQKSGYIGSISYIERSVNINGEEFSEVFKESAVQNSDRDNLGNDLSEGQAEYFKDSKVRDENGNLLVMYRGDSNNEFTVFDRKKSKYSNLYGRGFYFTASKAHAEQYGNAREFYLDIKNPLIREQNNITKEQMLNFLKAIENDGEDYDLYNYGQDATAESVLESVWGKGDYEMIQDINAGAIGDLVAAIELFNEVSGTSYDGIILPTETITFKSEQAKLTSNKAPTENEDIRFSMRENVEETKELVAVHNMQVSELERTLDLGGLPMPSIAIIKAKSGHSEYGDVSLVFPKSTIDPKASKLNKVYGGDAWTPTYPTIEYKPNAKVSKKISDKYYELSRKFGYDESRPLYNYVYDLEEQLNRNKGEAELLEGLYEDQNLMQLYLLDSGKSKVETIQKEIRTELTDAEVEMHEFFIKELGAEVIDGIVWDGNGTPMSFRKNYLSKYEDAIRNAYKKLLTEEYHFTDEQVQNVLDSTKASNLIQFMRDANKYRQNGRVTTRTEADYEATKQAIKDASADGYREWVDSLFKGVEEKSGIRNNADYFTNSGNRRSWEALHWENNLENVVKVMKSQDNGVAALFSGHAIWAVSAKDYRTVGEIKADADRLQRLSEEEYSEIKQGFGSRFEEIAHSIMSKSESNPFIAADNAMSCIVEAVRNSKTKSGLLNNLREYSQLTVTESTVDDIVSLVADISNMPTEYFEAKPRRAVELNEIATAIIPDNTSDATKTRLDDMGIKYIEYENGNEESRLNALNSLVELKFSDRMTESVYDKMGETARLEKENARLKKDLARLRERVQIEKKVTGGSYIDGKYTDLVAGHIRKIADSTYNKDNLSEELREFYSYSQDNTWSEETLFAKAYELAEKVLAESKPKTETNDYAKYLLKEIRSKRIRLSETQVQEAKNAFGNNYRNAFWGKIIIANNGISLDSQWQEWASMYPEFFDADVTEGDQITKLLEVYDDLRDASEVIQEYNAEEQTRWLAEEIINQYWNIPIKFTTADKYDARIKVLKFEHRQAMKEMRDDYEQRLKEQHKADKAQYKELMQNIRDRKDAEIARAKELGKERLDKFKESAERKTKIQSITANALTLNKWLTKNSKDYHIHEAMKAPVIKLLQAIDFSSKRQLEKGIPTLQDISFNEALAEVKEMLVNADNMVAGLEPLYGHGLTEEIGNLAKASFKLIGDNNYVINNMSLQELKSLDKLVKHIKKVVTELNHFHTVHHKQGAINLGIEFMEYGEKLGKLKNQDGKIRKFLKFRNSTPYYFFKRLGSAGKKIFEAFQDGWDKLAFNAKQIIDFTKETYTDKEVKKWSSETKEFTVSQPDGSDRTFNMTIAQIMSLHCVYKQEDAQRHLHSSGMTLARLDKSGNVVADYENISLTAIDIKEIISTLDDRQIEVADKLQKFMNTVCSDWGNEISMARFATKMFTNPDYFPIKVSASTIPTDNTKELDNPSLFRLLNMSFTHSRNKYADQSIEVGDIFDIFAQHSTDMAKYNALALPVLDFNKWYSIHGKTDKNKEIGVENTMTNVFGKEAVGYIKRFIRDINGSQNVSRDVIGNTFFKNAKVASVSMNLRVVLLQPTAYYKASAVMKNRYLAKAGMYIKLEPITMVKKLKKAIAQAEKYCGIIQWKSLGYYDTDISKGLTEKIKHSEGIKDKAVEKSLKLAEIADKVTFGVLWTACEFEVRDTRKELKVGSDEFYNAVANRLREVIYATQIVDSTMTRSDMMRSSDRMDKMLTTFGGEPTIAYNMLADTVLQFTLDKRELGTKEAVKKNGNKVAKVLLAYTVTQAMAALVESGFDVFRNDDDEEMEMEEFLKIYFKNFAFDMSIGNKLPVIKELYSIMQGYSSSRMDTQWMEHMASAGTSWVKFFSGEGKNQGGKAIKNSLRLMSSIFGFGFYNAYRDTMAFFNKIDLFTAEDLEEMLEDLLL